jgi:hypothetical protein
VLALMVQGQSVGTLFKVLLMIKDHGDRFLNEFGEFIQKPVPMISRAAALQALKAQGAGLSRWNRQKLSRSVIVKVADMPICRQ